MLRGDRHPHCVRGEWYHPQGTELGKPAKRKLRWFPWENNNLNNAFSGKNINKILM